MPLYTQSFAANAQRYLQSDQFRKDVGSKYNDDWVIIGIALVLCLCVIGIPLAIGFVIWKWPNIAAARRGRAAWQNPAGAVPIRTYPMMMNAEFLAGDMSAGPGVVIGSFDDDPALDPVMMMTLASQLHDIYANGPQDATQQPLCDMLRDHFYQSDRRRLIPREHTQGRRIYLFDLWLNNDWLPAGKTNMACIPCVAKPGDEGPIMIVPVQFAGDQEFFGVNLT
jgi:hypothetical protein